MSPKFYKDQDPNGRIPDAAAELRKLCEAGVGSQEMLLLPPCRRQLFWQVSAVFSLVNHRSLEVGLVFFRVQVSISSSVTWEGKVDQVTRES